MTMKRRVIITLVGAGLVVGVAWLPAVSSPDPTTVVTRPVAEAAPQPAPQAARPTPTRPAHVPEVARQEITKPGEGSTYAIFRNGKVYKVRVPQRRFLITHADGTKGERIEELPIPPAQALPPVDPAMAAVQPTPEQVAQMERIANGLE